jgi:hypothetical protein
MVSLRNFKIIKDFHRSKQNLEFILIWPLEPSKIIHLVNSGHPKCEYALVNLMFEYRQQHILFMDTLEADVAKSEAKGLKKWSS